jgi:hypothetical protein
MLLRVSNDDMRIFFITLVVAALFVATPAASQEPPSSESALVVQAVPATGHLSAHRLGCES